MAVVTVVDFELVSYLFCMDSSEYKEAERFLEEFKAIEFQVPLENMKREVVEVDGAKIYKDLYLVERLFPTLIEGLEELSR